MDELSPITSSSSSSDSSVQSASFDGQIVLLRAASILAQVTPPLIATIFAVVLFAPDFQTQFIALQGGFLTLVLGTMTFWVIFRSKGLNQAAALVASLGPIAIAINRIALAASAPDEILAVVVADALDKWPLLIIAHMGVTITMGSQPISKLHRLFGIGVVISLGGLATSVVYTRTADVRVLMILLPTETVAQAIGAFVGAIDWQRYDCGPVATALQETARQKKKVMCSPSGGSLISPSPSLSDTMTAYHKYRGFSPVQVLGHGSSGVVVLMQQDGKYVVSKRINTIDMTGTSLVRVENEVRILKSLSAQSRHIIHYLDSFQEMGMMCIILEFAEAGTLQNVVQQHKARGLQVPPSAVHIWLYHLASALELLHQSAVLHRDIKLRNIFLTRLGDVKLGDFGLARPLEDEAIMAETVCGTPYYLSPEKVRGLPYSKPADLWALGVVLYEILACRRPFEANNLAALSGLIQTCAVDEAPMLAAGHAPELTTLATALHLLHPNPEQRLTVTALLSHLRLHAGASGLRETDLSKGHEDCRQAALVGIQGLVPTERLPSV